MGIVPVIGAFTEMSPDVGGFADVTMLTLAAGHISFFSASAAGAGGTYKQRIRGVGPRGQPGVGPLPA